MDIGIEEGLLDDLPNFSNVENSVNATDDIESNQELNVDNVIEGDFTKNVEPEVDTRIQVFFVVDEMNLEYGEKFDAYVEPEVVYSKFLEMKASENERNSFNIYSRHIDLDTLGKVGNSLQVVFDEYVERVELSSLELNSELTEVLENQHGAQEREILLSEIAEPELLMSDEAVPINSEPELTREDLDGTADNSTDEQLSTEAYVDGAGQSDVFGQERANFSASQQGSVQPGGFGTYYQGGGAIPVAGNDTHADLGQTGAHVISGVGNLLVGGAVLAGSAARETGNLLKAVGAGISRYSQRRNEVSEALAKGNSAAENARDDVEAAPETVSEHMLSELSALESGYRKDIAALWSLDKMSGLREKLEGIAHERGVDLAKVMQSLPHDPELNGLYEEVKDTIQSDPAAKELAEQSGQSLNDWCDAYEALHERQQRTSEVEGREELDTALSSAKSNMEDAVSESPVYDDNELSQFEKLQEMVKHIVEKVKAFLSSLGSKKEEHHTPSPSL
ncbi:hypothetical protein [Citrobacter freundii]|uniref:hypothetical protein n=1 Tax=Citrobacter freundii TaxID=546 RepID=UPI001905187C|nr:hypothetical protein [Citrobacter freundii]MBJ8931618.1 hypothetical protein [Citrobacter freundii]